MHIGKIEADVSVRVQPETEPAEARGSFVIGLLFLAIAIPYWAVTLLAGALWRDLRRAGRFIRLWGACYKEAREQR